MMKYIALENDARAFNRKHFIEIQAYNRNLKKNRYQGGHNESTFEQGCPAYKCAALDPLWRRTTNHL
jgi:hypothetical protein